MALVCSMMRWGLIHMHGCHLHPTSFSCTCALGGSTASICASVAAELAGPLPGTTNSASAVVASTCMSAPWCGSRPSGASA